MAGPGQLYDDPTGGMVDPATGVPPTPWSWVPPQWDAAAAPDPAAAAPPDVGAPPVPPLAGPGRDPAIPPPVDDALAGAPPPPMLAPAPHAVQPLPPPDAISGGIQPGPVPIGQSLDNIGASGHYETNAERYSGDPLANPDIDQGQARLNWIAQNDPGAFAELVVNQEDARRKFADARRMEIINRDFDVQKRNLANREAADKATQAQLAAVLADADRISKTKIDPSGNLSVPQRIGGIIGAIVGGLVQGKTGSSQNIGLDILNQNIQRGIDAQKSDLVNQREGIGHRNSTLQQELARHGDTFQAEETVRLASLKHADDLLAIEQQNYDPRGTRGIRIAATRAGIATQQAQGLAAFQQKKFENHLKLAELADKEADRRAAMEKQRADQALGWANNNLANRRFGYDQSKDATDFGLRAAELGDKRAEKRRQEELELSIGSLPRLKVDDKGAPVLDDKGAPVVDAGPLTQRDGSVWRAPDAITRGKLADKTLAASEVTDMINEVLDIRDKVGGESSSFNSDEHQRLGVLQNRLVILQKSGTQGMSSDEDMKKLSAALGADSVASFRARAAGLKEGRDRTITELNKAYRIANYNGPKIDFPNPYGQAPTNTAEDDKAQALFQNPDVTFDDAAREAIQRHHAQLSPDQLRDPALYQEATGNAIAEARATFDPDASPKQQQQIADLAATARGDGAPALAARKLLQKASAQAHTARLRELAGRALADVVNSDTLGGGEPEQVR